MPSKLRKAIGAMKDQTSISLAKVSKTTASNLEVLILKATTHDEVPIDDRYVDEILQLVSSNKAHAAVCAHVISKRIGRTRNWIVALKSLMLILRIFQDGDPYFPREVLHAMKRGHKILNLSSFRDDSSSSPWDYTAFVRTFALYLYERLDCFLTGKLQRRFNYREKEITRCKRSYSKLVCDMKPPVLLDKISYWQRLLDRAIGSKPTGTAKSNKLVQISLYAVVQESFDLYRDISDGLALLLDSFFHLQYKSCVSAFQTCVRVSKQFEELCAFYDLCKSLNIGRTSEYPSVQKISEELLETLQEFLKDQASFPANGRSQPPLLLPGPANRDSGASSDYKSSDQVSTSEPTTERCSEFGSEFGSQSELTSQCTSLEDLISSGTSPSTDHHSVTSDKKSLQELDTITAMDTGSNPINIQQVSTLNKSDSLDIVVFTIGNEQEQDHKQKPQEDPMSVLDAGEANDSNWEIELEIFESTTENPKSETNLPDELVLDNIFEQPFEPRQQHYNPFLEDEIEMPVAISSTNSVDEMTAFSSSDDLLAVVPTFQAAVAEAASPPTFSTSSAKGFDENDPFAVVEDKNGIENGSIDQQILLRQQQLWLENQNKIIAKYLS